MWNEKASLELLKNMPDDLTEEHLVRLQKLLDANKYVSSIENGRDMCGEFAPFCKNCIRGGLTPCAIAYINMKNREGASYRVVDKANAEVPIADNAPEQEEALEQTPADGEPEQIDIEEIESIVADAPTEEVRAECGTTAEEVSANDGIEEERISENTLEQIAMAEFTASQDVLKLGKPQEVLRIDKPDEVLRIDKPEEMLKIEAGSSSPKAEEVPKKIRIAIARRKKVQ